MSQVGSWFSFAFVATAVVHLLLLLAGEGYSVLYVWQHTASYESVLWRLGALLAGPEGTLLVWTLFATAVVAWTARAWRRSVGDRRRDANLVHLVVALVALGLVVLTMASTPFRSFAEAFPSLEVSAPPAEGRGLNPVLSNVWMPVHTLLTFAGYALLGLVFAIGVLQLTYAARGKPERALSWRRPSLLVGRWAWLVLSAALLTGIIWAYEEMSFGWFWSWDPVESATLAVWLLLTAALHSVGEREGGRRQLVYTPLLMTLSFLGVVFASFVTRSGLHPSVHAFSGGSAGSYLGSALGALVVAVAILALLAGRRTPQKPSRRPWFFWAVWVLAAAAGLVVWGLGYPIAMNGLFGRSVELDSGFFTVWGYMVAVCLMLLMGFGMQVAMGRRRDASRMLAFFFALTVVGALVKPITGMELMSAERRLGAGPIEGLLGSASVLSLFPPAVYALMVIVERWWSGRPTTSGRMRVSGMGSAIVHVGVVAAILGATLATVMSSSVTIGVNTATGVGVGEHLGVVVVDVERSEHFDRFGELVEEREKALIEVWSANAVVAAGTATLSTYPERNMGRHPGVMISRGPITDFQVIYHGVAEMSSDGVPVTVRRIPFANLLWLGLVMLIAGMAMITSVPSSEQKRRTPADLVAGGLPWTRT
jgi:cytochrome c-type biogenesis protein CcmF